MGLFSSKKVFKTSKAVREALFAITTLDTNERSAAYEALVHELDSGGISAEEIERVVRELRREGKISDIDAGSILKLKG